MSFDTVSKLNNQQFKRATGVSKQVFELMVEAVNTSIANRRTRRGNISSFSVQDQVLIMLEYYREYPTMFHMSVRLGIHESSVCRIINKIELVLVKNKLFQLPPKQELAVMEIETIVVDATEITIQRPKKTDFKNNTILEKRKDTPSKLK
jgi:Helix-turn-helix of DDE superfamily endonuclease